MHDHSSHDPGTDLALWATGDHRALERVLAIAVDPAYQQALRLLGHAADAEDAAQEALVQLIRSARYYDVGRPFRPWLAHLVHVACCRFLRSGRRRRRHEEQMVMAQPTESHLDVEAIRAAVLDLPEAMREAIELHYFAGLSQAEAALSLDISENACAVRLHRARERLRHLLLRRGAHLTASAALALLVAKPASAAPVGLATTLATQAAAGVLPTSTIPLTVTQQGVYLMSAYPHVIVALMLGIGVIIASPFLASGVETTPTPIVPVVAPPTGGTGDVKGLLAFLDPRAPFQVVVDLAALRPDLAHAKPYTLADDQRLATAVQAARTQWQKLIKDRQLSSELRCGLWLFPVPREVNGLIYYRNLLAGSHDVNHWFLAADVSDWAGEPEKLLETMGDEKTKSMSARVNNHLVIGSGLFMNDFTSTPPLPAWFKLELGPVQIREVSGVLDWRGVEPGAKVPRSVPLVGETLVSDQWRYVTPRLEGRGRIAGDKVSTSIQMTGVAPISPLVPLGLLGILDRVPAMSWPLRKPTMTIPESPDRLAFASLGMTPPTVVQPPSVAPDASVLTKILANLMTQTSGDLAIEVRPGIPIPKLAVVVGLRAGADSVGVAKQIAERLHWQSAAINQAGAPTASVTAEMPISIDANTGTLVLGQQTANASSVVHGTIPITITALPDRLILTLNASVEEWPGIGSAVAAADASGCTVTVDLQAMANQAWHLLGMDFPWADRLRGMAQAFNGPVERSAVGPVSWPIQRPLAALGSHLPVWSMRWDPTTDGGRIEEHGIPIMTSILAAAGVRLISEMDRLHGPASENGDAPPPAAVSDF